MLCRSLKNISLLYGPISFHSKILQIYTRVDLDFKVNFSLDPELHIHMIPLSYKAYKVLIFIKRSAYDFKLGLPLKILSCSLAILF